MKSNEQVWVVVLAAGEGKRVKDLTRDLWGEPAPKQYSSIDGSTTLLGTTLKRAKKISPPERIVPIVAAQHHRWWVPELTEIPPENVIVQPENRGTAAGILLPLLWITQHDPDAVLVILPSDHGVASEHALQSAIIDATVRAGRTGAGLVLLGVKPERPETGYGWIVPRADECGRLETIASFREKPDAAAAALLFDQGALLNSFILISEGRFLLDLFESRLPQLWHAFQPVVKERWDPSVAEAELACLYRSVPMLDFSKDLLEQAAEKLWVYPVPACGWLDLGTPERLTRHLADQTRSPRDGRKQASTHPLNRRPSRVPRYASTFRSQPDGAPHHTPGGGLRTIHAT
ncbi:MAG: sugar phosphate nucleotidyltransferase [Acidobacteriota bacterium]|nr:sugar phosphate nucleotidyltransferase [Acidobacteriota bacterium]